MMPWRVAWALASSVVLAQQAERTPVVHPAHLVQARADHRRISGEQAQERPMLSISNLMCAASDGDAQMAQQAIQLAFDAL